MRKSGMTDFDAFMDKLRTLPPMGATPTQNTFDFWREIDVLQTQHATRPGGQSLAEGQVSQLHSGLE